MSACRRMKIDPYLSRCTKINSKWIKDFNINPVTVNCIDEKVGSTLECIGTEDHFLNMTPVAQTLRETINKWELLKLKSSVKQRTWSTRQNDNLQNGKRSSLTPHQTED